MGKRDINASIKTITNMLEYADMQEQVELNKILRQYKKELKELDDKASKRQAKKKPIVVQDDTTNLRKSSLKKKKEKLE
jgi:hypothetical protein